MKERTNKGMMNYSHFRSTNYFFKNKITEQRFILRKKTIQTIRDHIGFPHYMLIDILA